VFLVVFFAKLYNRAQKFLFASNINFYLNVQIFVEALQETRPFSFFYRLSGQTSRSETPDRFGLRKVVVVVTEYSKLYGIDSMSGSVLWQAWFPGTYTRTDR
jgi:hypothetical protein